MCPETATAIASFYEAYPPASGAAAVTFNLAKFLSGDRLLVQIGSSPGHAEADGVRVVTVCRSSENRLKKIAGLRMRIEPIVREIASFEPGYVILEGASWALYHLLLMRALRQTLPTAKIVYHSHNVEYLLRRNRNGRGIAAITRWAEGGLLRKADLSTAVSPVDQDHFQRLYGVRPILLPNGVDFDHVAGVCARDIACMRAKYRLDDRTILFSGFYAYPPNREAIDFLVKEVMPAVRERFPSATLALTGGGSPYHEPWITNAGLVPHEDFAAFVAACGIAVAPIFSGSGTRLKILEAMAAGLPVVASRKAAEGLPVANAQETLFAQAKDEFVNCIVNLIENPTLAQRLRERAKLMVASNFSWKVLVDNFARIMTSQSTVAGGSTRSKPEGLNV